MNFKQTARAWPAAGQWWRAGSLQTREGRHAVASLTTGGSVYFETVVRGGSQKAQAS